MTLHPHDTDTDVAAVRSALGPANPVVDMGATTAAPAGWSLVASNPPSPVRRRVLTATAIAGAAALVAAAVALGFMGRSDHRGDVAVASNPRAVLTAYGATVSAGTAQGSLLVTEGNTTVVDASGIGDLATGDADVNLTLPAPLGRVEVRSVGGSAYVQIPSGFVGFAGGKPWVKVDRASLQQLAGRNLGSVSLNTGFDFNAVLAWLNGVGQVSPATPGTSHGDATSDYHAVIDLTKAAGQAPAAQQGRLGQLAQAAGQSIPVDLSIDQAGRLRRLQATFDLSRVHLPTGMTLPAPAHGVVTATLELWGFGTHLSVTAPAADQVTDAGALLPLLRGGSR